MIESVVQTSRFSTHERAPEHELPGYNQVADFSGLHRVSLHLGEVRLALERELLELEERAFHLHRRAHERADTLGCVGGVRIARARSRRSS